MAAFCRNIYLSRPQSYECCWTDCTPSTRGNCYESPARSCWSVWESRCCSSVSMASASGWRGAGPPRERLIHWQRVMNSREQPVHYGLIEHRLRHRAATPESLGEEGFLDEEP